MSAFHVIALPYSTILIYSMSIAYITRTCFQSHGAGIVHNFLQEHAYFVYTTDAPIMTDPFIQHMLTI